jgi:integrase
MTELNNTKFKRLEKRSYEGMRLNEIIDGKLTLLGFFIKYFPEIGKKRNWAQDTFTAYENDFYNHLAIPLSYKPLNSFSYEEIAAVIRNIEKAGYGSGVNKKRYQPTTINHLFYLISLLYDNAKLNGHCIENPLWGTALYLPSKKKEETETKAGKIRKSLTIKEELHVYERCYTNVMQAGELMGVLLMFACGLRNSEACAINFEDIIEIPDYPHNYCIRVFKSTGKNTNETKASGKTKNADRLIPITNKLHNFISERKRFIQGEIGNKASDDDIEQLPIVCTRDNYRVRCTANDLSIMGKKILREANVSSSILGLIDSEISKDTDILEKEPTAYLLRRNFATHLHLLDLSDSEIQYVIGHDIDDPTDMRHYYSNPDRLIRIKRKLDNRPLISDTYHYENLIKVDNTEGKRYFVSPGKQNILIKTVSNKSDNRKSDAFTNLDVRLSISATEPLEKVTIKMRNESSHNQPVNLHYELSDGNPASGNANILKQYHKSYDNAMKKNRITVSHDYETLFD